MAGEGEFGRGTFAASFVIVFIRCDFLGLAADLGVCVDVGLAGEGGRGMFAASAVMSGEDGNIRASCS